MSDDKHPLTETEYDIIGPSNPKFDEDMTVDIPEIKSLDTIIDLALDAYKTQMETLALVDPSKRVFYLETANKYLKEAKDAIYKKEYIMLQRDKASKKGSNTTTDDNSGNEEKTRTRAQLLKMKKG